MGGAVSVNEDERIEQAHCLQMIKESGLAVASARRLARELAAAARASPDGRMSGRVVKDAAIEALASARPRPKFGETAVRRPVPPAVPDK